jgi:hypothetical protein
MVLWKEYQRIKEMKGDWTDNDVRILLNFCWEIQLRQYELGEELKKALETLQQLRNRIDFYRAVHAPREVKS